jgi:formylglycine-generating enzyme required for sulfatase activity
MHGYLWEFVGDVWHDTYSGAPADGSNWAGDEQSLRLIRGGSWKDRHEALCSAHRKAIKPDEKDDAVGLRCVKAKRL